MKLAKLLLPCLLVLACNTSAKAQDGLGLAYFYGYGGFGDSRIQSYTPAPPYFALHPPVYYGQRYTRPYGASPFAAWPQLQPNAGYAPRQHVNHAATPAGCSGGCSGIVSVSPSLVRAEAQPQVIENPFYQPEEAVYTAAE